MVDEVNFNGADLRGVTFSETSLNRVNLSGADLSGAKGIDADTIRAFSCILTNTRMPDGSIYSG
jgi:uncharacterized protein YjbI with pentapeptide repeats